MNKAELESRLKRLQADFEDLEEAINFNFAYSSAHISGSQVSKDEESLRELREEICRIAGLLSEMESGSHGK